VVTQDILVQEFLVTQDLAEAVVRLVTLDFQEIARVDIVVFLEIAHLVIRATQEKVG